MVFPEDHQSDETSNVKIELENLRITDNKAPLDHEVSVNENNEIPKNFQYYFKGFCHVMQMFGTFVGCLIVTAVASTPIVMIVMGATYFKSCPSQPMIPVHNIINGFIILLAYGIFALEKIHRGENLLKSLSYRVHFIYIMSMLFLLTFGWTIVGGYWIFTVNREKCNEVIHNFTLFLIIFSFIAMAHAIVSRCCSSKTDLY